MGGTTSTQLTEITNNLLNQSVTNVLNSSSNLLTYHIDAGISAKFILERSTVNCTGDANSLFTIVQDADVKILNEIDSTTFTDLKTLLTSAADASSTSFQDILREMGGGLESMTTEQKTDLSNNIQNIIETNITETSVNEILQTFTFKVDAGVKFTDSTYTGPCNFNITQTVNIQSAAILSKLSESIASNESVAEAVASAESAQKIRIEGLAGVIESIGEAIANVFSAATLPIIIAIAVVAIAVPMLGGAFGGKKTAGILFVVVLVLIGVFLLYSFFTKTSLFEEKPPQSVIDNGCESEWKETVEIDKQYDAATTPEEEEQILLDNESTINAYKTCMKIEDYSWESYRNSMRGY